jgi:hypothetical protein
MLKRINFISTISLGSPVKERVYVHLEYLAVNIG